MTVRGPIFSGEAVGELQVRPLSIHEAEKRIRYFHDSSDDHLRLLGVDRRRLPPPGTWLEMERRDRQLPIEQRRSYQVAWELSGELVGFSTADRIRFGDEAFMHLHILDAARRLRGLGTAFVRLSVRHYFDVLKVERILCEPNAFNTAPNRTLQAAGFRYLYTHVTTPGPLNHRQPVTRWSIERASSGPP